ncbi:aspartate kinase [Streptomyces sp. NPDC005953]|uniref:aspartate kinase n=1 Tax=unclassified Streptomyces TaxID=2593676 RepID=UPI0033CFD9B6
MDIAIRKYGGSSLATDRQVASVAEQVAQAYRKGVSLIVVVSARGKTTDRLVDSAGNLSSYPDPLEMDKLLATGEAESAALLAITLVQLGVPARSLSGPQAGLRADGLHGAGVVSAVDPLPLRETLGQGRVAVVAGFQALNPQGELITLGRGGSDTSAVAIAAGQGIGICEIYTDVDGVHRADPRVVPDAPLLSWITADVMAEAAFSGAGVMHPRAVELAAAHEIDIVVRNSAGWEKQTTIVGKGRGMRDADSMEGRAGIVAVTHEKDIAQIIVRNGCGIAVVDALARLQIPVDSFTWWSEPADDLRISFCIPDAVLDRVLGEVTTVVSDHGGSIEARRSVAKVSIVGVGLLSRPGLTTRALTALAQSGITAQCASTTQARTTYLVPRARVESAVTVLYQQFQLGAHDGNGTEPVLLIA